MARRTRKQQEVQDSLEGVADAASTPEENSAPLTSAKREAAKDRRVSAKELAMLLDRDRNTIAKWQQDGMPYVEAANRDLGKPWVFDIAEVVRWMERRAMATAAKNFVVSGDVPTKDQSQAKSAYIRALNDELEFAEAQKVVVRISTVVERVASDYGELRNRLIGIPDAVAAKVQRQHRDVVKKAVHEQISNALKSLKADRPDKGQSPEAA